MNIQSPVIQGMRSKAWPRTPLLFPSHCEECQLNKSRKSDFSGHYLETLRVGTPGCSASFPQRRAPATGLSQQESSTGQIKSSAPKLSWGAPHFCRANVASPLNKPRAPQNCRGNLTLLRHLWIMLRDKAKHLCDLVSGNVGFSTLSYSWRSFDIEDTPRTN